MDVFARFHPLVLMGYYVVAFSLLLAIGHPLLFTLTAVLMFLVRLLQDGIRRSFRTLLYSTGAVFLCMVLNPLFNHRGVTLIGMIGNMRITKEAFLYGGHMALMLIASLCLFACFSRYMTVEKIMALSGRCMPAFSLLFSIILRTMPKVKNDYQAMTELHGNSFRVWSALLGVVMEDGVERSIAMRQKYYGEKKRSHYWTKKFMWQDWLFLMVLGGMVVYLFWHVLTRQVSTRFFPSVYLEEIALWQWCLYIFYMGIPIWLRGKEECKWFLWKRKITGSVIHNRKNQPFPLRSGR